MRAQAVELCDAGDAIIINGGTTTFQMVHYLSGHRLQVMTNSFAIAEHLVKHSKNTVTLPGGAIYREQSLILSPFDNDAIRNFYARRMFIGAQGVGPLGIMEADALIIQSEQKLMHQADELVVHGRFQQVPPALEPDSVPARACVNHHHRRRHLREAAARMIEDAGVSLVIASVACAVGQGGFLVGRLRGAAGA